MLNPQLFAPHSTAHYVALPTAPIKILTLEESSAAHPRIETHYPRMVHGTPITPEDLLAQLTGASFCVSFVTPDQLEQCILLLGDDSILILDNGAFSHWRSGKGRINRRKFWRWVNAIQRRCPQAIAVVPDVIDGNEAANALEVDYAFAPTHPLCEFPDRAMFVWHMNESFARLEWAARTFKFIAIGSCNEFDVEKYRQTYLEQLVFAEAIIDAVHAATGHRPFVHLMRGLGTLHEATGFDSADSTNIARNHHRTKHLDQHIAAMHARLWKKIAERLRWVKVSDQPWTLCRIAADFRAEQWRSLDQAPPSPLSVCPTGCNEIQRAQLAEFNSEARMKCFYEMALQKHCIRHPLFKRYFHIVHDSLDPGPIGGGSFRVFFGQEGQLDEFLPYLGTEDLLLLEQKFNPGELLLLDREGFWDWANGLQEIHDGAVAVVPCFAHCEQDTWREASYALREELSGFPDRTMFVWHLSDSDENLQRAARLFNFLAIRPDAQLDPRRSPKLCLERLSQANRIINRVERTYRRRPYLHLGSTLGVLYKLAQYDGADAAFADNAWPDDELVSFLALAKQIWRKERWGRTRATSNFNCYR